MATIKIFQFIYDKGEVFEMCTKENYA